MHRLGFIQFIWAIDLKTAAGNGVEESGNKMYNKKTDGLFYYFLLSLQIAISLY